MNGRRLVITAVVLATGLLLWRLSAESLRQNLTQLLVTNGFSTRFATPASVRFLRQALALDCGGWATECGAALAEMPVEAVIRAADERFLDPTITVQIVADAAQIPVAEFMPSGLPASLQDIETPNVLYGPGFYQTRLYLVAEDEGCWGIGVRARHDDPPPVELEIWLDKDRMGTLSYDRGDQSWEELAITLRARPNLHWLRVWFVNDMMDETLGIDRNAYIEHVTVSRLEDAACAD